VNDEVLYASENIPDLRQRGFYDHGQYPFVFDTLFVEEGTPCGFGYIDVMKDPQMYIDKLNQIVIKHAYRAGNPRWLVEDGCGINEEEYRDETKSVVHVAGRIGDNNYKQIDYKSLDNSVVQHLNTKVEELKETSGNRDFSQGSTSSGVTAASAIAALQEAGSKLSRDMIKQSYRAHTKVNYLCLENIRQFYTEPRSFRINGEQGQDQYVPYSNKNIIPRKQGNVGNVDLGYRRPVFDIKITSQKSSPFAREAQNARATELYNADFFNPQRAEQSLIALSMMDFEGKDMIVQKISQNAAMVQTMIQLATIVDAYTGSQIAPQLMQQFGVQAPMSMPAGGGMVQTNALGKAVQMSQGNTATKAQERATNVAKPR
jgi:hypothetical protein